MCTFSFFREVCSSCEEGVSASRVSLRFLYWFGQYNSSAPWCTLHADAYINACAQLLHIFIVL